MINPKDYNVDETFGFVLPNAATDFSPWTFPELETAVFHLKDVSSDQFKTAIDQLPELSADKLPTDFSDLCHLHRVYATLASAVIWADHSEKRIKQVVPRQIGVPLYEISESLGLQPIFSHMDGALSNWRLIDRNRPFQLDNIECMDQLPNNAGGRQWNWFSGVTVTVEVEAAKAVMEIVGCSNHMLSADDWALGAGLQRIANALLRMRDAMSRMHDRLDASVFYEEIRPWINGYSNGELFPDGGVFFEGVGRRFSLSGASAAQSTAIAVIDSFFGVTHQQEFLWKMRQYMPACHRRFLTDLEEFYKSHGNVRDYVVWRESDDSGNGSTLKTAFNECISNLAEFRSYHFQLITKYILVPSSRAGCDGNVGDSRLKDVGTGGQPVVEFLQGVRRDTNHVVLR